MNKILFEYTQAFTAETTTDKIYAENLKLSTKLLFLIMLPFKKWMWNNEFPGYIKLREFLEGKHARYWRNNREITIYFHFWIENKAKIMNKNII